MTTTPSSTSSATNTSATATTSALSKTTIGYIVQLGGIAAFATGAVLSFHHAAIAAAFAGGAAAFFVGKKIRSM
jgi:hypothetical protein